MLSSDLTRWFATNGFDRRATPVEGRGIVYRLADGSGHVEVSPYEWQRLGERFAVAVKPARRRANWICACLPPGILLFALTLGPIVPFAGILILLALFGLPTWLYFRETGTIRRVARSLEQELARRPRVAPPARPRRNLPHWLEIAATLLVGPYLLVQLFGSVFPDAYRNTPWSGTQLDWKGLVGFLILAVVFLIRWRINFEEAMLAREEERSTGEPRRRRVIGAAPDG